MKKLFLLTTAAFLFTGISFADNTLKTKKKKCAKGQSCCKKTGKCCKDKAKTAQM